MPPSGYWCLTAGEITRRRSSSASLSFPGSKFGQVFDIPNALPNYSLTASEGELGNLEPSCLYNYNRRPAIFFFFSSVFILTESSWRPRMLKAHPLFSQMMRFQKLQVGRGWEASCHSMKTSTWLLVYRALYTVANAWAHACISAPNVHQVCAWRSSFWLKHYLHFSLGYFKKIFCPYFIITGTLMTRV